MMVEPHKHCPVCGNPIPLDERTCSKKCAEVLLKNQQRVMRTRLIFYIVLVIFIVVWLFVVLRK